MRAKLSILFSCALMLTGACATDGRSLGPPNDNKVGQADKDVCREAERESEIQAKLLSKALSERMDSEVTYKVEICRTLNDTDLGFAATRVLVYDGGIIDGEMLISTYFEYNGKRWVARSSEPIYVQKYNQKNKTNKSTNAESIIEL